MVIVFLAQGYARYTASSAVFDTVSTFIVYGSVRASPPRLLMTDDGDSERRKYSRDRNSGTNPAPSSASHAHLCVQFVRGFYSSVGVVSPLVTAGRGRADVYSMNIAFGVGTLRKILR